MEFERVFDNNVRVGVSYEVVVDRVESCLVGQGCLALVIDIAYAGFRHPGQNIGYSVACVVHAGRMGLYHGCISVDVDYEAGQKVTLAVYQTEGIIVVAAQTQDLAHAQGIGQTLAVEFFIYGRVCIERKHAHGDAAYLEVSYAQGCAVGGDDAHYVAFFEAVGQCGDGSGEHPGMKASE